MAFFSMEYALSEALPIYSGGLGQVAGDYLKTACLETGAGDVKALHERSVARGSADETVLAGRRTARISASERRSARAIVPRSSTSPVNTGDSYHAA